VGDMEKNKKRFLKGIASVGINLAEEIHILYGVIQWRLFKVLTWSNMDTSHSEHKFVFLPGLKGFLFPL
jgi:hypothetical protein